jgi:hypothetical protein
LVITFRTQLNTDAQVFNVAAAYWDANGNGNVTDDVLTGQVPLVAVAQFGATVAAAIPIDRRETLLMLTALLAIAGALRLRKRI